MTPLCERLLERWKFAASVDGWDDMASGLIAGGSLIIDGLEGQETGVNHLLTFGIPVLYMPTFSALFTQPCLDSNKCEALAFQLMLSGYYLRMVYYFEYLITHSEFDAHYTHEQLLSSIFLTGIGQTVISAIRSKEALDNYKHRCQLRGEDGDKIRQCDDRIIKVLTLSVAAQAVLAMSSFQASYCHLQHEQSEAQCSQMMDNVRTGLGVLAGAATIITAFKQKHFEKVRGAVNLMIMINRLYQRHESIEEVQQAGNPNSPADSSNTERQEMRRRLFQGL